MKDIIQEACKVLHQGGIILYPTDTVWGLGCDATNEAAVQKILALKQRSAGKSFVVLAHDMDMVEDYVEKVPEMAEQLVELSASPLTLIYPGAMNLAPSVVSAAGEVAIRVPAHDFCSQLLRKLRKPLVSTSANISDRPTPVNFEQIDPAVKAGVDWVAPRSVEGKPTGKASSIVKLGLRNEVTIIRE